MIGDDNTEPLPPIGEPAGKRPQTWWWSLTAIMISFMLMIGVGMWYTQWRIDQFGKKLCAEKIALDDFFSQPPPPDTPNTPTRQKFAEIYRKQRAALRCDG